MKKNAIVLILAISSVLLIRCGNESANNTSEQTGNVLEDTAVYNQYLSAGAGYASEAGKVLIKNLTEAINSNGPAYAVQFCNTRAIPLTDSMSSALHLISLKRVSDRNRNPDNKANEQELEYIELLKPNMQNGEAAKPKLMEAGDKITGYYPIITNTMCMNCHADKSKIDSKTLAKINELYPSDAATGYAENQLRGLWVIEMEKKK